MKGVPMVLERKVEPGIVEARPLPRQVVSNTGINRRTYARIPTALEMPNLVQIQLESFEWFRREGLRELLEEISPITDHHKKMELSIFDPRFDPPWHRMPKGEEQERAKTRSARLRSLVPRARHDLRRAAARVGAPGHQGDRRDQGDRPGRHLPRRFPDDDHATARSSSTAPSAWWSRSWCARRASTSSATRIRRPASRLSTAKLIPNRGAWLEFETSNRDVLSVKVDRKRKMPVTILLRAHRL